MRKGYRRRTNRNLAAPHPDCHYPGVAAGLGHFVAVFDVAAGFDAEVAAVAVAVAAVAAGVAVVVAAVVGAELAVGPLAGGPQATAWCLACLR